MESLQSTSTKSVKSASRNEIEARLRSDSALTAGQVATYIWDIPGDRVFGDESLRQLFGLQADEEGASPLADYVKAMHPDDRAETMEKIRIAIQTDVPYEAEYRVIFNNRERWVVARGRVEKDQSGKPIQFTGVIIDLTDRKLAEQARRRSELRYLTLFNSINLALCTIRVIFDSDGKGIDYEFLEVNPAFESQSGLKNAVGRRMLELAPGLEPEWAAMYGRVAKTGVPAKLEHEAKALGRWFEIRASRVDEPGEHHVAVAFTDVTARRKAESDRDQYVAALQAERENLAAVVREAPSFIAVFAGPTHVFQLANERYYELIGRREVLGRTVRQVLPEVGGQGFFEALDSVYSTGEPVVGSEVSVMLASGPDQALERHVVNYVFQPIRGVNGAVSGVFVHGVDVTESVAAREAIAVSERRRRLALDTAELGGWNIDAATLVLTADARFYRLFGMPDDSCGYEQAFEAIHPDDRDRVRATFTAAMRNINPVPYTAEYRVVHPDGSIHWLFAKGRANFQGEGAGRRLTSLDGTVADITERKLFETEREHLLHAERAARAEAELAGKMKDEFLATLSHELRTPLNAIVGWTQILRTAGTDAEDLAEGLAVIDRNARAQTQIIEDILDMSRIISGKLRLDVQQVDLAGLVKAGADTLQPAADAKSIRLQVMLDPSAGPITGDPGRLHQVFWNLISNAVKFTARGGRVQVLLQRINSHVEVSVIDTGEGISPEFLPHVFDRFRQADATTTRRHGGLGLGLAIVKQLVELHGGSVRANSPGVGQGATFTVSLPLVVAHADEYDPSVKHREHPATKLAIDAEAIACDQLAGVNVVAVDDEPDGVEMIKRLLTECGANVRTATSASEAFALITAKVPDVLISDIGMPGEDGYALIRKVRALPAPASEKVQALALTAYARTTDRMRALEAGFQMHLAKPVELAELIVTVASLAKRARR